MQCSWLTNSTPTPPNTSPVVLAPVTIGVPFTYSLAASLIPKARDWLTPIRFKGDPVIAGLAITTSGQLKGTPIYVTAKNFRACAYDGGGHQYCRTFSLQVNPSRYAGTYTGVFSYEYQNTSNAVPGMWIPMSFTVSLTMKDSLTTGGTIHMIVSNLQSSEPAYGTGPNGVAAVSPTWAWFIANPPTSPTLRQSSGGDDVLHIYLPNGTSLNVDFANNFMLSANGDSLSSDPDDPANPANPESHLSWLGPVNAAVCATCAVAYLGWSLTKTSASSAPTTIG